MQSKFWKLRYPAAIALIAMSAAVATYWREILGHRGASLFFMTAIVCIGAQFGQNVALMSAILAYLAFHFFILDVGNALALDPTDILALATFLFAGLLVGGLSGRASDRARAATERSRELASLLAASKEFASAIEPQDCARLTVEHLARLGLTATVQLQTEGFGMRSFGQDAKSCVAKYPLQTADRQLGVVSIETTNPQTNKSEDYVSALLEISAIALDRALLLKEITHARVIGEREGLRTALLSSLSHDLRTPIATILASASTLADPRAHHDDTLRADLASAIQEEAERLNRYIANLLEMTRLQSGAIDLRRTPVDPSEIADSALSRMRDRFGGRTVTRQLESRQNLISIDPVLLEQAIVNIIENAIDHAGADAAITIGVTHAGERVELFVEDDGPGVPVDEQSVMFEKFFRGKNAKVKPGGVGLGLSVVRGIVEAFDGAVAIKSPVANDRGSAITMSFPLIAGNES